VRSPLLTTPGGFDAFISQAGMRLIEGVMQPGRTPDQMQKLLKLAEGRTRLDEKTCERYGYWLATPKENAFAGIAFF
jgi:hypothetical protein